MDGHLSPFFLALPVQFPGIMATRTIENRKDRLVTILIAPLMTCFSTFTHLYAVNRCIYPS